MHANETPWWVGAVWICAVVCVAALLSPKPSSKSLWNSSAFVLAQDVSKASAESKIECPSALQQNPSQEAIYPAIQKGALHGCKVHVQENAALYRWVAGDIVDPKTADAALFARLPGVGTKKAAAMVEARRRYGPARRWQDLMQVKGIGEKTARRLAPLLGLDPDFDLDPAAVF